jgi:hypothetical protein
MMVVGMIIATLGVNGADRIRFSQALNREEPDWPEIIEGRDYSSRPSIIVRLSMT